MELVRTCKCCGARPVAARPNAIFCGADCRRENRNDERRARRRADGAEWAKAQVQALVDGGIIADLKREVRDQIRKRCEESDGKIVQIPPPVLRNR